MLRSLKALENRPLSATDGEIGTTVDFLFDDAIWVVRYLVVDVGKWLANRDVVLSPVALSDARETALDVNLTKEQIANSPDIDTAKPISRRQEERIRAHFGWPLYWEGAAVVGAEPVIPLPPGAENVRERREQEDRERFVGKAPEGDPHLRSANTVKGYHIAAADGGIGHIDDFIVDDQRWYIRYAVVDTRNWLPGKRVLASPDWVREIDWAEEKVFVDVTREQVKNAPAYDPTAPVNREYEQVLYDYYGRQRYW